MKRRNFLKGLLGLAALPIAAKAGLIGDSDQVLSVSGGIEPRKGLDVGEFRAARDILDAAPVPTSGSVYWNGRIVTYHEGAVHFSEVMDYDAWNPEKRINLGQMDWTIHDKPTMVHDRLVQGPEMTATEVSDRREEFARDMAEALAKRQDKMVMSRFDEAFDRFERRVNFRL